MCHHLSAGVVEPPSPVPGRRLHCPGLHCFRPFPTLLVGLAIFEKIDCRTKDVVISQARFPIVNHFCTLSAFRVRSVLLKQGVFLVFVLFNIGEESFSFCSSVESIAPVGSAATLFATTIDTKATMRTAQQAHDTPIHQRVQASFCPSSRL